ncbi:MAG: DUF2796 domain-containing protein [Pseudomonadota bacterium]
MGRIHGFILALALCVAAPLVAQPLSLGPHEHGVGQFNIVLDGNELLLELLAPAGDIAGFEHMPVTVKERMTVRRVAAQLAKAERQFALPEAAGCALVKAEVDGEQMEAIGHKHEDGHDHGHAAPAQGMHAHAEYHAVYRYACARPQALGQIDVKLFGQYKALGKLRWQAVLSDGARAGEVTGNAPRVVLR